MAVSSDKTARRGRYTRRPVSGVAAITPRKLSLLRRVSDFGIASLPQLAALAGLSEQSARRHLRVLFDEGLVDVVAVARVALADPTRAGDASLLYGSAPNIYTLTRAGGKLLAEIGPVQGRAIAVHYGPRNSLFLAHELAIRDVRVWLELSARGSPGHRVEQWVDGSRAAIDLGRSRPPRQARPDAWFVYRLGGKRLVGLLEVDRGTERGSRWWEEKTAAYGALLGSNRLREVTGALHARILVVTLDARRRDRLCELIGRLAPPTLARQFWLAERSLLAEPGVARAGWQQPGSRLLRPLLLPEEVTGSSKAGQAMAG